MQKIQLYLVLICVIRDPHRITDVLFGLNPDNIDFNIIFSPSSYGNFMASIESMLGESRNTAQLTAGGRVPGP